MSHSTPHHFSGAPHLLASSDIHPTIPSLPLFLIFGNLAQEGGESRRNSTKSTSYQMLILNFLLSYKNQDSYLQLVSLATFLCCCCHFYK